MSLYHTVSISTMAKKTLLIAMTLLGLLVVASLQEELDELTGRNNYVVREISLCVNATDYNS